MITRHRTAVFCYRLCFCLFSLVFLAGQVACQSNPTHSVSSFNNLPSRLFFFDDTSSAVYHDSMEGNVYVSQDEGKTWQLAEDVPKGKAMMVIQHPFDNHYAFVLTDGKTHYRTADRGKTWRSFSVPSEPALVAQPLSFHSDPKKYGYILYQGSTCDRIGFGARCYDETFYTKDAFGDTVTKMLSEVSRCQFAHSHKDFKHDAHSDLIYCVAFETSSVGGRQDLSSSLLFSSTDFFKEKKVEDLGIGRNAKGVLAFAIVSKFGVVALKDLNGGGILHLYVTVDTNHWAKAQFPHASSAVLKENAYTIVESTTHSLAVDVVLQDRANIGTLFVSNSNGTFFVESLKDTNRNDMGFVDYERLYGVEGVGLANVVTNAQDVETRRVPKQLKTYITFDDGSSWNPIRAPTEDSEGRRTSCNPADVETCSLHLHSVTTPHNFGRIFSSPAPGIAMGVGSIGDKLKPYEDSDTFLSIDAGVSWKMIRRDAHKYEFGDSGSILVVVEDEDLVDTVRYSLDLGKNWKSYNFGVKLRARALTTLPDSTSQKFLLLGQVARADQTKDLKNVVIVHLDFSETRKRKCAEDDFEKWYARSANNACIMGHKQWYKRRKPDADCYVGEEFSDPVEHEENCECTDDDYECDYNFVRSGKQCVPVGPEPIPAGVCADPNQTYKGSSGFRKIPGNTCVGGKKKDEKVEKKCSQAQPAEGEVSHQIFEFESPIAQYAYFNASTTILVRLMDFSIWQSPNEGYTWTQPVEDARILGFYHHKYSNDRAYLVTDTDKFYYTTNTGKSWHSRRAPSPPNSFGVPALQFHPETDLLIWIGNKDCNGGNVGDPCRGEASFSRDNGNSWSFVEHYVKTCAWAKDAEINTDPNEIICESYRDKKGNQRTFRSNNALELVAGSNFYAKKKKLFDHVVGFTKFSEFLVVAELLPQRLALDLQVSLDGFHFATGQFPPSMHPDNTHAYTVLESSTKSLFLHMTMSEPPTGPFWGTILKSNSNGTYFGIALENVNRNNDGYVDFEKLIGLDGIALVNVVSNTEEARISGHKQLQTRITHNDGSTWKPLNPPSQDSQGNKYECQSTKCALHIHGYTERFDPRATYSSPSSIGLVMAVGNVGESLAPYRDSDTFLSRDAGFTWEEIHKDAHLWEFGDSGSILIMVNDEEPTDHVLFSTNEGLNWREYKFSDEKLRINTIMTVPSDTSRRFILMGSSSHARGAVLVHLDFSALTSKRCEINIEDPGHDDFELWSPSEERAERCLFGRQTMYHRRVRDRNCVVGDRPKVAESIKFNCPCAKVDFECEFNHVKNENDECVLVSGTTPLRNDDSCKNGEEFWYERTAYRLIPYSSCEAGERLDRGVRHRCPGLKSKGVFFWLFVLSIPIGIAALVGYYYYRRNGLARGTIRLPGDGGSFRSNSGVLDTLASVPWYIVGISGIAFEWVASRFARATSRSRGGYRNVSIDEDAQILRFEDEE